MEIKKEACHEVNAGNVDLEITFPVFQILFCLLSLTIADAYYGGYGYGGYGGGYGGYGGGYGGYGGGYGGYGGYGSYGNSRGYGGYANAGRYVAANPGAIHIAKR
jgi:hypothetical protein